MNRINLSNDNKRIKSKVLFNLTKRASRSDEELLVGLGVDAGDQGNELAEVLTELFPVDGLGVGAPHAAELGGVLAQVSELHDLSAEAQRDREGRRKSFVHSVHQSSVLIGHRAALEAL